MLHFVECVPFPAIQSPCNYWGGRWLLEPCRLAPAKALSHVSAECFVPVHPTCEHKRKRVAQLQSLVSSCPLVTGPLFLKMLRLEGGELLTVARAVARPAELHVPRNQVWTVARLSVPESLACRY